MFVEAGLRTGPAISEVEAVVIGEPGSRGGEDWIRIEEDRGGKFGASPVGIAVLGIVFEAEEDVVFILEEAGGGARAAGCDFDSDGVRSVKSVVEISGCETTVPDSHDDRDVGGTA